MVTGFFLSMKKLPQFNFSSKTEVLGSYMILKARRATSSLFVRLGGPS